MFEDMSMRRMEWELVELAGNLAALG